MSDTKTNSMEMTKLEEKMQEEIAYNVELTHVTLEATAKACTAITIEHMGLFIEWAQDKDWRFNTTVREWQQRFTLKIFTTDQLIQEYIKTL